MVTITIDCLPPTELRANNHSSNYWYARAEASKKCRHQAMLLGMQYTNSRPDFETIHHCEIEEVFVIGTRRKIDIEGLMGACKPYIDGIKDAGIIWDDDWQHVRRLTGRVIYQRNVERTEINIKQVKSKKEKE